MYRVIVSYSFGVTPMYTINHPDYVGCYWYDRCYVQSVVGRLNSESEV